MPCALEFAREGGAAGQAEAASARSRTTFFAKNVVGLMLQPLTPVLYRKKLRDFLSFEIRILVSELLYKTVN